MGMYQEMEIFLLFTETSTKLKEIPFLRRNEEGQEKERERTGLEARHSLHEKRVCSLEKQVSQNSLPLSLPSLCTLLYLLFSLSAIFIFQKYRASTTSVFPPNKICALSTISSLEEEEEK